MLSVKSYKVHSCCLFVSKRTECLTKETLKMEVFTVMLLRIRVFVVGWVVSDVSAGGEAFIPGSISQKKKKINVVKVHFVGDSMCNLWYTKHNFRHYRRRVISWLPEKILYLLKMDAAAWSNCGEFLITTKVQLFVYRPVKVPRCARLYPLVLISLRGCVDPRAMMRPKGLSQRKISKARTGIETAAFVVQCLNQPRYRVLS